MVSISFQIFFISFLINLLWENIHSQFYKTCLELQLNKYISLIIWAALKDGFWITLFFIISVLVFWNINILNNSYQILFFVLLSLLFSFVDEKISLKLNRWEYSQNMFQLFGVGISPLFELAITGLLTFVYVFIF